jgi:hypothetical protein
MAGTWLLLVTKGFEEGAREARAIVQYGVVVSQGYRVHPRAQRCVHCLCVCVCVCVCVKSVRGVWCACVCGECECETGVSSILHPEVHCLLHPEVV